MLCRTASGRAPQTPSTEQIALAIRKLTDYRSSIARQNPYQSAELMRKLARRLPRVVRAAIAEAVEAEQQLAKAIAGSIPVERK